jgi:hypothetical protein
VIDKELKSFIATELVSNLHVLIDPNLKDSFNDRRVKVWMELVSERIIHHLTNKQSILNDKKREDHSNEYY